MTLLLSTLAAGTCWLGLGYRATSQRALLKGAPLSKKSFFIQLAAGPVRVDLVRAFFTS